MSQWIQLVPHRPAIGIILDGESVVLSPSFGPFTSMGSWVLMVRRGNVRGAYGFPSLEMAIKKVNEAYPPIPDHLQIALSTLEISNPIGIQ